MVSEFELLQGDSVLLLRDVAAGSVDAIITDPPYNSGGASAAARTGQTPREKYQNSGTRRRYPHFDGDQRDQVGFAFWCHQWLAECRRVARDGAPILLFSDWRQLPLMTSILQSADFIWRGIAVWDKPGCRPQLGRFAAQSEFVIWGSKGRMPIAGPALPGVFSAVVRQADKFHLTGKPTELMMQLVRITAEGGTILDPFAGSGTTGVAALRSGRRFIGMEREGEIVEIARRRLTEAAAG